MIHIEGSKRLAIVLGLAIVLLQVIMFVGTAQADTIHYTLDNVILADGQPITGEFDWTFNVGDFEGGSGVFTSLDIPWTVFYSFDADNLIIDIQTNSIEITGDGSFHDKGLDIRLVLSQPINPTQSAPIDLTLSWFECCGNGFKDQPFISGSISPIDDFDGDGVGDESDNCREVANPDQRDTNSGEDDNTAVAGEQHYGNICDPDFNNDGLVNQRDNGTLRSYLRQTVPPAPEDVDLDGDGWIGRRDSKILKSYLRYAPGPGIGD